MANSGSNFGGLIMTLAGARENTHAPRRPPPPGAQDAPRLWDFDGHLPADGLKRGLYFCDIEWGGRHGVCTAKMLAERRSMLFV